MAGLDSIQKFDDGGEVDGGLEVAAPKSKTGPSVKGDVYLDPESTGKILKNMEAMVAERQGPLNQLLGGLKDASAWGSGGLEGPTRGLALRDAQKQKEQEDLLAAQNQMATYRAALAQQSQTQGSFMNALKGQTAAPQTGAAPAASGTPSSGIDPQLMTEIERLAANPATRNQAMAMYQKAITEGAGFRARAAAEHGDEIVEFPVNGENVKMTRSQAAQLARTNPTIASALGQQTPAATTTATQPSAAPAAGGVTNFGNMRPAGSSTGFQQFKSPEEGLAAMDQNLQAYGKKGINTLSGIISRWAPPSENDTQAYIKDVSQRLGIKDPNQPLDLNNPMVRQALGTAIALHEHGPQKIFATAQPSTPPITGSAQPAPSGAMGSTTAAALTQKRGEAGIDVQKAAQTDIAKKDAEKKAAYLTSLGDADDTYSELSTLLDSSKGKNKVFNLSGQGLTGPIASHIIPDQKGDTSPNDKLARTILRDEDQTDYKNAKQGAAVAQSKWAKSLVQGAGGRLTNADLNLGGIAKGVGPDTTYDSHMQNLAKQMEAARTIYYRGKAFKEWSDQNPNGTVAEFEQTPYFTVGAKIEAAKDVADRFKDVPESKFSHKDAKGNAYYIVNGKRYYL